MKLYYSVTQPNLLTHKELDEIVKLHQTTFNLSEKSIIKLLHDRDEIILYRNRDTEQLIGTIGFSLLKLPNAIILYIGNVVIEKNYRQHGILLHSQLRYALKSLLKFPLKPKFFCGLASTYEAHQWAAQFPDHWPHESKPTPKKYFELMEAVAKTLAKNQYKKINRNAIIVTKLAKELSEKNIHKENNTAGSNKRKDSFIEDIDPTANQGNQLLMLGPLSWRNFRTALSKTIRV